MNPGEIANPRSAAASPRPVRVAVAKSYSSMASRLCAAVCHVANNFGSGAIMKSGDLGGVDQTVTTRSASRYGNGCSTRLFTTLNIAVVAPMPSASVSTAIVVQTGWRRSVRSA